MRARIAMLVLSALLSLPACGHDLTVFAASSLQNALEDIGRLYRQATGTAVRFSFASSGALARQIEHGAPAALFVSADEQWMDYLAERRLIVAATRRSLLGNRLVLVVPADRAVTVELKRSSGTKSGYAWSSADGPPFELTSMTLATGSIRLADQRPVDWLLP